MRWAKGASYSGNWSFNQAYGEGKFTYPDGTSYQGHWSNNKRNGHGKYETYEGEWKDDL